MKTKVEGQKKMPMGLQFEDITGNLGLFNTASDNE